MCNKNKTVSLLAGLFSLFFLQTMETNACTGGRLMAKDGSTVYGRTMEWGAFDLNSRVAVVPRGYSFTGLTPDGYNGKTWQAKYGFVGLDMLEKDLFADAVNEKGCRQDSSTTPGMPNTWTTTKHRRKTQSSPSISSPTFFRSFPR